MPTVYDGLKMLFRLCNTKQCVLYKRGNRTNRKIEQIYLMICSSYDATK